MSDQYHGVAITKSETSDLWFTFCPACSTDARRQCRKSVEQVPAILVEYTFAMHETIKSVHSGLAPDRNAVAVSRKAKPTQVAAARGIYPKSGTIQGRILELITEREGLTDEELERILGMKHQSVSAARNVLMNKGWIINSGRTRPNLNGNSAIVWVRATQEGA